MIASYNASVVNFYNATGSLVRFINKNIFFFYSKNALAYLVVNLKIVGLAPDLNKTGSVPRPHG
jgi:hypothetical protein